MSAQTRLLTGSTQPSCASASSAAVRAASMAGMTSKPRLGRCVPVHLSTSACPLLRVPVHHRPVPGRPHRHGDRGAAAHLDPLVADLRLLPAVGRQVPRAVEALQVQVLRVGVPVGDRPGDRPVEAEVREPGQPGERGPGDVEVRAGHPALPVHVRRVECPVRVVADHRGPVRGTPPADGPRVGPGLDLGEEAEVPLDLAERLLEQPGDRAGQPAVGRHRDRRPGHRPGLEPFERGGAGPGEQHRVHQLVPATAPSARAAPGMPRRSATPARARPGTARAAAAPRRRWPGSPRCA